MKHITYNSSFLDLSFEDSKTRLHKLKNILAISMAMLMVFGITNLIFSTVNFTIEYICTILIILFLYGYVSSDTTNIVSAIYLWTITIISSYFAWRSSGLHSASMSTFPSLLVFANILGGRMLVYPLAGYMLLVIYFFAYAESINFINTEDILQTSSYKKATNLTIILIASGIGIDFFSRNIRRIFTIISDNHEKQKKSEKKIEHLLSFDSTTGLPNETACQNDLQELLSNINNKDIVGFITLKFTNFNWIYSSLGQNIANRITYYLADRLNMLNTHNSRLYRSQENEFIYISQATDNEEISEFCHQLIQAIARPFPVESFDIEMSSVIGISKYPVDGESFNTLRKKSHAALTIAEQSETNSYKFYQEEMETSIHHRIKMVQELKQAIYLQEFELYYQAKIDLKDECIIGAEALIRWNKAGKEIINPLDFIPIAEESGLINEIGKWVIEKACEDCQSWHKLGFTDLSIAVNISPIQFQRGNIVNIISRSLVKSGLNSHKLELEVTESLFMDNSDFIKEQIKQISKSGVQVAIDDFGTGYSNLNYLTKFYATTLKIDMSFIKNILETKRQGLLVSAIIEMSKVMGLKSIAEGIENKESYIFLKELGCQYGQGYYWCKPMKNSLFIKQLKSQGISSKTVEEPPLNSDKRK